MGRPETVLGVCLDVLRRQALDGDGSSDVRVVIAAGRLVVAHAELNVRFADRKKSRLDLYPNMEALEGGLQELENCEEKLYRAFDAFLDDPKRNTDLLRAAMDEAVEVFSRHPQAIG